ncbi:MAG: hypothetical protein MHM6MM_007630 [Cercozoa sp. M6MM]
MERQRPTLVHVYSEDSIPSNYHRSRHMSLSRTERRAPGLASKHFSFEQDTHDTGFEQVLRLSKLNLRPQNTSPLPFFVALQEAVPSRLALAQWKLIFSVARDGQSLGSLQRRLARHAESAQGECESVLICQTKKGDVLGAFVTDLWRQQPSHFGTGESFVFRWRRYDARLPGIGEEDDEEEEWEPTEQFGKLDVYTWSGDNDFFQSAGSNGKDDKRPASAASYIAVGGGTRSALRLDADLVRGSTGACETFHSPPLVQIDAADFELALVEVWGFSLHL